MTTRHLVDPELLSALEMVPALRLSLETLPAIRAGSLQRLVDMTIPEGLPVSAETISIPGPQGAPSVPVFAYTPTNVAGPLPALLHIHGGGYILGSAANSDARNRMMAVDLGCAIFSVEYRLAPETVFPGAVEDCYAALKWIAANAAKLNVDPARIGVKGDSAGGGLAAGLALLARDRGEVRLAFQHLIYPMLDDRTGTTSEPHPHVGEFIWTADSNRFGWQCLLGQAPGGPDVPPYAAAARASDLAGLPPTFISVGALDLFLEEDVEYARRLARAGVPVELHVYPGAWHGFDVFAASRVTDAAERDGRAALKRAMER